MESKLIDTLLQVGRARGRSSEAQIEKAATPAPVEPATRREAGWSDFTAVVNLKTRCGLSKDSIENWQRLWRDNPALQHAQQPLPMGWVQEAEGKIVGYMGSIPLLYQFGDQRLIAAATTCYAVDPTYRASSLGIVGAFLQQPGCDLYLDTTATESAGKIMKAFRAVQVPQKDYDTVLFWVLRPRKFLQAAARKLELAGALAAAGALLGSPLLSADILFRGRYPRSKGRGIDCRQLKVEEIGDDFDDLWQRKLGERPRLLASRTAEDLRWHFLVPNSRRKPEAVACYRGGRLAGYAIVQNSEPDRLGLRKSLVADLLVGGDDPAIISELLRGAYQVARRNQSDVLELLGYPAAVRSLCRRWNPYSRKYPACPFFYKAARVELGAQLAAEQAWYAGPFDGDTTLSPQ